MSNQCVVAVFDSFKRTKHAVQALESSAFSPNQVSLVTHSVSDEVLKEEVLQYGDETEKGAAKGAGVGGDPRQMAEAQRILRETNAEEVHLHAPTSADAREVDDS